MARTRIITEVFLSFHEYDILLMVLFSNPVDVINAAGSAGIDVIPLVWTLVNEGETFDDTAVPRINAVTQVIYRPLSSYIFPLILSKAVINNPGPVLAVAMGDEVNLQFHLPKVGEISNKYAF